MQTFPSFYEVGSCSESYNNFLQGIMGSAEMMNSLEDTSCVSPRSLAEAKAIAANKSHSEAERRRRKRINGHLATLRTLLPNTIKTDKASLLAEAVKCVRELKKTTTELAAVPESDADDNSFSYAAAAGTSGGGDVRRPTKYMFPSETDELKLSYAGEAGGGNLKAALCCEDRPEIITELVRALKSVEGKVVRAEMATVGGRIKCVLWVHVEGLNGGNKGGEEVVAAVRRALKVVVDRSNAVVNSSLQELPGHKRPRLYQY
ncbi:PREDICTED: transcription factor bHLH30-like [Ipomoea nil]|uniref:transcription factor bHLH30-like n=1 Tax=Ipomoea nil TaxID=35883 RepID=UPI0009013CE4|nr:PREDICTED: transcription factor bHLH30-like [Ipomoea nil]XP_019182844.1 PREDICTED: transcription factor bHLH30-like [Ipomoea nil]